MANPLDTFTHDNLFAGSEVGFATKTGTVLSGEPAALARGAVMGKVRTGTVAETRPGATGNGVMGAITKGILAKPGVYKLKITTAAANAGDFQVLDPEGNAVGEGRVGVAFVSDHLNFTLADGATDFILGDTLLLTVAAGTGKLRRLDVTATDGTALPFGILTDPIDASLADKACAVYMTGEFNTRALSFDDATTIDTVVAGKTLREWCRELGMHFYTSMNTSGVS